MHFYYHLLLGHHALSQKEIAEEREQMRKTLKEQPQTVDLENSEMRDE